jgi:outer membrane immunogenic protein
VAAEALPHLPLVKAIGDLMQGRRIVMRPIFAAGILAATWGVAAAADMPRAPRRPATPLPPETSVYLGWSGFYLGLNAGGGIANVESAFAVLGNPAFASVNNSLSGAIGGGQAGFNWQTGVAVLGVETDFQASGLKGGLTAPCAGGLCALGLNATYNQKVPWFGTARGRLGVAASGWLIYATAGYAYARLETDAFASAGPVSALARFNETRNGWTAGGGIEVAIAPSWSAKLEYLYLDLGRTTIGILLTGLPTITDDARFTVNVVRAGLNYRF